MYGNSILFLPKKVVSGVCRYSKDITKKLLGVLAEMPKANSARIAETQRHRKLVAKKSEKYGPSTVYLQVIGSGARGAPNTLYLFSDQKRYLFNCGECTQRLAHEHKVKLSRLNHIFITRKTWRNIGGLPGLSLTLQDVGVPNITLHGPDGLDELYNATKRFVIMKDMNVTMAKCVTCDDFEDEVMTVKYVTLTPMDDIFDKETKPAKRQRVESQNDKVYDEFACDDTDYYKPEVRNAHGRAGQVDKKQEKPKPRECEKAEALKKRTEKVLHDLQKLNRCTIAYICTLKKRLGTLDLAKCVERGVKPGPQLGQLKSGLDVVLSDGTLVLSKDVKTPDDPGPVFIVLEVPEITYLKESDFAPHFNNDCNPPEQVPSLIVHYTPPHVLHHPTYRAFMAMFGPSTRHLIMNSQNNCLGSEAVHRTQHKLHLLDHEIFPLLRDVSIPAMWNQQPLPKTCSSPVRVKGFEELKNKIALAQFQNILNAEGACGGDGGASGERDDDVHKLDLIAARTLTAFHLRPKRQLDRSAEPKLHIQDYYQETMDTDGFVSSLEQFRQIVDNVRYMKTDSQNEYPKVVFLGTGSCIPSKTRNTSCIVLQINENSSMLLDCGEGSYGQLVRFFGPKRVNCFLRTLKAIYVSHLHADHHIGLIGVLQARRKAFEEVPASMSHYEPVSLLAPGQIVTWLSIYDQQFEKINDDYTITPNQSLVHNFKSDKDHPDLSAAMLAKLGVDSIKTCFVSHCPNAFGVAINIDNKFKITYSGDTIPCEELVQLGQNSTLLIHEATMEDELADEARVKMHSTTSQAIEVGKMMNAKYTLLTHFSQRYARLPRLNANMLHDNKSVGIAFDNMQITMDDLELLPHMYAPLQLMFAEHCVEMELKAANRTRQKDRRSMSPKTDNKRIDRHSLFQNPGYTASNSRPHANYRESHASKLRQEAKGMAVCGLVGKSRRLTTPQSKLSRTSIQKATTSPPTSDSKTPAQAKEKISSVARSDSSTTFDVSQPPHGSTANSENTLLLNTRYRSPKHQIVPSATTVIDTHSKTLNSIPRPLSCEDQSRSMQSSANRRPFDCSPYIPNVTTAAYSSKPYVSPESRRSMFKRQLPDITNSKLATPMTRTRIPSPSTPAAPLWRSSNYNAGVSAASVGGKNNVSRTTILLKVTKLDIVMSVVVHLIIWRVSSIVNYICRGLLPFVNVIIAAIALFWTATSRTASTNRLSPAHVSDNVKHMIYATSTPHNKPFKSFSASPQRNRPSSSMERTLMKDVRSTSHSRERAARLSTNCEMGSKDFKKSSKMVTISNNSNQPTHLPNKGEIRPSGNNPATQRKASLKLHQTQSDNLKTIMLNRDKLLTSVISKPYSLSSNKSFKPQLEDIKSSLFLIKQEEKKCKLGIAKDISKEVSHIPKPKQLNEQQRKEQLLRIKNKYKSKQFFTDAKYDKIEGLNWISWK